MDEALQELIAIAGRHAQGRRAKTAIPRVTIGRSEVPTPPLPELCQPTVLFVLQGTKTVTIGDRTLAYSAGSYFVYPLETPAISQLIQASSAHPYLAIAFALDVELIAGLIIDHGRELAGDNFVTDRASGELLDAWRRTLRLLDRPAEIPVLAPMLEREIAFRLLQGPQGAKLYQLAKTDGRLSQIRRATSWIRRNYDKPINVSELATLAHMSNASFHRHFKAATAMSPIQYQKQVRLLEARHLLIAEPGNAARVAFSVGYESASQFSREYARQFGLPPARDAARLLAKGEAPMLDVD